MQIGYLLKVARDTNILAESGYATVTDFAKAEYGIDKTQVSRFISINDRFSEDGYSDHLLTSYKGIWIRKTYIDVADPRRDQRGTSAYVVQGRDSGHKGRGGC